MKEVYEKPTVDIEKFKTSNIITTSGNPGDDNNVPFPWG